MCTNKQLAVWKWIAGALLVTSTFMTGRASLGADMSSLKERVHSLESDIVYIRDRVDAIYDKIP